MLKHLMWSLLFLKVYSTEIVLVSIAITTRKTFHKWVWKVVAVTAQQKPHVVSLRNATLISCK
jgi:hypothetical protein